MKRFPSPPIHAATISMGTRASGIGTRNLGRAPPSAPCRGRSEGEGEPEADVLLPPVRAVLVNQGRQTRDVPVHPLKGTLVISERRRITRAERTMFDRRALLLVELGQ